MEVWRSSSERNLIKLEIKRNITLKEENTKALTCMVCAACRVVNKYVTSEDYYKNVNM